MLTSAGLPVEDRLICCGPTTQEEGAHSIQYLLEETPATAVLLASSPLTVGAMNYINSHNISVPERISLVSFANYEWMPLCNPPMDGIKQPNAEIGLRAAERMLEILADPDDKRIVTENLKCTYIEGKSVYCVPNGKAP